MSETMIEQIEDTASTIRVALDAALARAGELERQRQDLDAEFASVDTDVERARILSRRCDVGLELGYVATTLRGAMAGIALAARHEREPLAGRDLRRVA